MSKKLIIAYKTRVAEGDVKMPTFSAPKSYKDQKKIDTYVAEQEAKFSASLKDKPYTGTFEEVRIFDASTSDVGIFKFRTKEEKRDPICLAVRNWILKRHPEAWPHAATYTGPPEAIFVGFSPRVFLKILGIECSLPENQPVNDAGDRDPNKTNVLPLSLWYGQSDHRDIGEAANPKEFDLSWEIVMKARKLEEYAGWNGPGTNTETDLKVAIELATQLGMLAEG